MNSLIPTTDFIDFLSEVGSDFSLAQGLGGNGSVKSQDEMFVKASGKRLGDSASQNYFYQVGISNGEYHEINPSQEGRPSIEVFLHAMLPYRYVLHLHSTRGVALSMLAATDARVKTRLTKQGISLLDYRKPGIELKQAVGHVLKDSPDEAIPSTFLLTNHGTLFGANSISELRKSVLDFEDNAAILLGSRFELKMSPGNLSEVVDSEFIENISWHAQNNWRISPDHVVFLGAHPSEEITRALRGPTTAFEILQKAFPRMKRIGPVEEQLLWFINVVQFLPKQQFPILKEKDAIELLSWEAENHRVKSYSDD